MLRYFHDDATLVRREPSNGITGVEKIDKKTAVRPRRALNDYRAVRPSEPWKFAVELSL